RAPARDVHRSCELGGAQGALPMTELTHRDYVWHAYSMYAVAVLSGSLWLMITRNPYFSFFAFVIGALPVDPKSIGGRRWLQALLVFARGGAAAGLFILLTRWAGIRFWSAGTPSPAPLCHPLT